MNSDDQIKWVTLTLTFSPEQEPWLEKAANAAGLSVKCYCIHGIYKHLLNDVPDDQKEAWQKDLPATLRRNGCLENPPSNAS